MGHTAMAPAPSALQQRLQDPQVQQSLQTLLDHADLLALLVSGLDQMVGRSDIIADSLVSGFAELRQTADDGGNELDLEALTGAARRLAAHGPQLAAALAQALDTGLLEEAIASATVAATALPQVDTIARGLVAGSERFVTRPVEIKGPVSLLKLLKDPDINRAMSFFLTVAQAIGQELNRPASARS